MKAICLILLSALFVLFGSGGCGASPEPLPDGGGPEASQSGEDL